MTTNIPKELADGRIRVTSYIPGVTSKKLREEMCDDVIMHPKEPLKVAEILKDYRAQINSTPALLSLLYDADMMPEQCVTVRAAISCAAVCEAYKAGKDGL